MKLTNNNWEAALIIVLFSPFILFGVLRHFYLKIAKRN